MDARPERRAVPRAYFRAAAVTAYRQRVKQRSPTQCRSLNFALSAAPSALRCESSADPVAPARFRVRVGATLSPTIRAMTRPTGFYARYLSALAAKHGTSAADDDDEQYWRERERFELEKTTMSPLIQQPTLSQLRRRIIKRLSLMVAAVLVFVAAAALLR
jgi:hypothetical protein